VEVTRQLLYTISGRRNWAKKSRRVSIPMIAEGGTPYRDLFRCWWIFGWVRGAVTLRAARLQFHGGGCAAFPPGNVGVRADGYGGGGGQSGRGPQVCSAENSSGVCPCPLVEALGGGCGAASIVDHGGVWGGSWRGGGEPAVPEWGPVGSGDVDARTRGVRIGRVWGGGGGGVSRTGVGGGAVQWAMYMCEGKALNG